MHIHWVAYHLERDYSKGLETHWFTTLPSGIYPQGKKTCEDVKVLVTNGWRQGKVSKCHHFPSALQWFNWYGRWVSLAANTPEKRHSPCQKHTNKSNLPLVRPSDQLPIYRKIIMNNVRGACQATSWTTCFLPEINCREIEREPLDSKIVKRLINQSECVDLNWALVQANWKYVWHFLNTIRYLKLFRKYCYTRQCDDDLWLCIEKIPFLLE